MPDSRNTLLANLALTSRFETPDFGGGEGSSGVTQIFYDACLTFVLRTFMEKKSNDKIV